MFWTVSLFLFLSWAFSCVARHSIKEAKQAVSTLNFGDRIGPMPIELIGRMLGYIEGFVFPYAIMATWLIASIAFGIDGFAYLILGLCLLMILSVYYSTILGTLRVSVIILEFWICLLCVRSMFHFDSYISVGIALIVISLSKAWGELAMRLRGANMIFVFVSSMMIAIIGGARDVFSLALCSATIGALVGDIEWHKFTRFTIPRHSDTTGSFAFYIAAIMALRLPDATIAYSSLLLCGPLSLLLAFLWKKRSC